MCCCRWPFASCCRPLTSEFLLHHQEHVGGHHHRPDRTDRGGARSMQEFSFQVFEAFTAATLMYLGINVRPSSSRCAWWSAASRSPVNITGK